jgi:gentisate 1,2-dioxygenase
MKPLDTLDALYAAIDGLGMEGGWHRRTPSLWPEPRRNFHPHRWRYADVKPILDAAGTLVDTQLAERRNLTLTNPVEGNAYATVRTLVAAYQMIRPGETARAHRHTPNALRIILEGRGTYTVVDGTRVEMLPGDVLLTPGWCWHSHESIGQEDCYWIDVLDVPLVHLLEPMFYEKHPQGIEPNPVDAAQSSIAFRWEHSLARLAKDAAPAHGMAAREIELGAPAMKTIALHVQQLPAGFASPTLRTTANAIYTVVEGRGTTHVDGEAFPFARGDVIAVPSWRHFRHEASEDTTFVRASDEPAMAALGFLRSETLR